MRPFRRDDENPTERSRRLPRVIAADRCASGRGVRISFEPPSVEKRSKGGGSRFRQESPGQKKYPKKVPEAFLVSLASPSFFTPARKQLWRFGGVILWRIKTGIGRFEKRLGTAGLSLFSFLNSAENLFVILLLIRWGAHHLKERGDPLRCRSSVFGIDNSSQR